MIEVVPMSRRKVGNRDPDSRKAGRRDLPKLINNSIILLVT